VNRTLPSALVLACVAGAAHAAAPEPFRPDLATVASVPRAVLPAATEDAFTEADKSRPYQFAVAMDLALEAHHGAWSSRNGAASWRVRLLSRGARTLSLHLPRPKLPAGARIWVYDPAGRLVHGPYDGARLARGGLWTPPVAGEELVLEVRAAASGDLGFGAAKVFHGFRGWTEQADAGSCTVDITCPQAADWTADAGSVARISIGGQFLCTGQLVNNVRQDQRRLFLTADHCGVDGEGGPASSVLFFFDYAGPCGDNLGGTLPPPTFQGAQRLAHDRSTDFALLEITDPAPLPADAYFAGWDATGRDPAAGGVSIHHPSGDEKKIAFHDLVPDRSPVNIGTHCRIPAWKIHWSEGVTQQGSSGGGLWDPAHNIIGILSGGFASCRAPLLPDYFARLDAAWTAREAVGGQLKAHLDPDNTCVAVVPGLDPDTTPAPGPVAPTPGIVACAGSGGGDCSTGVGGALDALALALLALAARRRLQHHQQHARDRHR
jgi:lysyl endopeptidase